MVTKLLQTKAAASIALDGWDPRTAVGAAVAKRQAADALPGLREEYRQEVAGRVVKVFVYGDPQRVKDMSTYLEDQGAVVIDGQYLYNLLATPVESTVDRNARRFDSHQTLRLRQEYLDVARLLELADVPELKTAQTDYDSLVQTPEATLAACKKIIRRTTGDALNQVYLDRKVVSDLLDSEVTANYIPVVITGCDEDEIGQLGMGLFPGQPSLLYKADDVVNFEAVRDELSKKVVKLLKKPEQQKETENE